jgi:uncharacterized protein YfkK (UPF0435 family)
MSEETQTVTDQGVEAPQAPQAELGVADLQNLRTIIDVASRRGAFSASEMTSIGSVYDRLNKFLEAVAPAQAPETEQTTPAQ